MMVHSDDQEAVSVPTAYEDKAVLALTDAELLGRCKDDIGYLGKGHRPGSAADAIGIARDYRELVRRFEREKVRQGLRWLSDQLEEALRTNRAPDTEVVEIAERIAAWWDARQSAEPLPTLCFNEEDGR